MKTIYTLIFAILWIGFIHEAKASHYMGGEITWECKANGKFVFTLKYYRECGGITFPNSITLSSNSPAGSITMPIVTGWPKDITPTCNNNPNFNQITCANVTASNLGAIEEYVYRSAEVMLNGVPPASGWVFYHSSCCRNPATNVTGQPGWALRAIMYPYNNQNTYPCFDNSPTFAEPARSVMETGFNTTYNHLGHDIESDSIAFEWGQPWTANNTPLTSYQSGYSYQNPLPSTTQNPNNIPATLDPQTGQISYKSYTTGAFVTSVKAKSYKNGVKIAEIWRDIQITLKPAGSYVNLPPLLSPLFASNTTYYLQTDTFYVGQYISLPFLAMDNGLHPDGSFQTISLSTWGNNFGSFVPPTVSNPVPTFSATSGCKIPPCATMSPAPGPGYPLEATLSVASHFSWQTECVHLANNNIAGTNMSKYNFYFKVTDDYCPVPAFAQYQYRIILKPQPQVSELTEIKCVQVDGAGDVKVYWDPIMDSLGLMKSYDIYASSNPNGPYAMVAQFYNPNETSFKHLGAGADQHAIYYYIETVTGCTNFDADTARTDTVSSIYVDLNPSTWIADLNWKSDYPLKQVSQSNKYHVYTRKNNGHIQYHRSVAQDSLIDTVKVCQSTHAYKVEIMCYGLKDSLGNTYSAPAISNYTPVSTYKDLSPPDPVMLTMVTIDPVNADARIFWIKSPTADVKGYFIYKFLQNNWQLYDTVFGAMNTAYVDTKNSISNPPHPSEYKVASFDHCYNISQSSNQYSGVGIGETSSTSASPKVYPIPTDGKLYIEAEGLEKIEVYDGKGSLVYSIADTQNQIDLSHLEAGVYFLKITADEKEYSQSIVVE